MNNEMTTNKNKGFSLVELIVVIAIMAVMVAVLAPSLLQYVERSRAQKDDSAMGEVANAIMLGLSDQKIYDEVLYSTAKGNVSCYVDSDSEAAIDDSLKEVTKAASDASNSKSDEQYMFTDDARLADEVEYKFGEGIINKGLTDADLCATNGKRVTVDYYGDDTWQGKTLKELQAADNTKDLGHHYLYNRVRATVGDSITLTSQTYRNSEYTVFIRMGSTGGNSAAGQDSVKVYGQWNGTNLS